MKKLIIFKNGWKIRVFQVVDFAEKEEVFPKYILFEYVGFRKIQNPFHYWMGGKGKAPVKFYESYKSLYDALYFGLQLYNYKKFTLIYL